MSRAPEFDKANGGRRVTRRHEVEVHIDELVLHGFAAGDRYAIAEAVQQELARLMGEGRLLQSGQNHLALKQIDAGAFQIQDGSKANDKGSQIARSVFRGLRQQMRTPVAPRTIRAGTGGTRR